MLTLLPLDGRSQRADRARSPKRPRRVHEDGESYQALHHGDGAEYLIPVLCVSAGVGFRCDAFTMEWGVSGWRLFWNLFEISHEVTFFPYYLPKSLSQSVCLVILIEPM